MMSGAAQALNVLQWQDNMVIPVNEYIEFSNYNEASKLSDNPPSIIQDFAIDLVSSHHLICYLTKTGMLEIKS